MPDLGKGGLPGGAHTLRRRVGGGQVRVLGLEFPEFDDEGIELGVGDLGVVEGVVELVVVADQGGALV